MIASHVRFFAGLALAASFGFVACEPAPRDPWQIMVALRIETDLLCPPEMGRYACVLRRWEAFGARLAQEEPALETALELCHLGACEPGNVYSGPWVRACKIVWRERLGVYYTLTNPCTCPRGGLLEQFVMIPLGTPAYISRAEAVERLFLPSEVAYIETKQSFRKCSKPAPGLDRMLATRRATGLTPGCSTSRDL